MAILQALFALITKSAGKILNAIFGWAVHALFGRTSSREQTVLSGLVALAVAWPLLLVGLVAPKLAALLLAFVPVPRGVPSYAVRIVWLVLAVAVPVVVGLVVASRAPPEALPESFAKRALRGFPITIGLAGAFLLMFASVPIMRLAALVRHRKSADLPLITDASAYHQVATAFRDVLDRHGMALERAHPRWWISAPMRILLWFGGDAFRSYVPRQLEHFESPELAMSLYPSGVLLRGDGRRVAAAHALVAEAIIETNGLETVDPAAQALERDVRSLWKLHVLAGAGRDEGTRFQTRIAQLSRELAALDIDFEEWRALYRQILQVDRALRGDRQLMENEVASSRARFVDDAPTLPSLAKPDWDVAESS
jgi:hypothetical protein